MKEGIQCRIHCVSVWRRLSRRRFRNQLDALAETISVFTQVKDPRVLAALGPAGVRGLAPAPRQAGGPHADAGAPRRALRLDLPARPAGDAEPLHARQEGPVGQRRPPAVEDQRRPARTPRCRSSPSATSTGTPRSVGVRLDAREKRAVRLQPDGVDALAVLARRAGRALRRRAGHRGGAVLRREALRLDAGDGRGAPRRGLPPLPRREARQALPDQRQPLRHHRLAHERRPLGHEVPRHADHGRGARARRVRDDLQAHARSRSSGSSSRW